MEKEDLIRFKNRDVTDVGAKSARNTITFAVNTVLIHFKSDFSQSVA